MTRAVIDTNVLVSGVMALHGAPRRVLEAWHAGQFTLITSEVIIAEVTRVLHYPRIYDRYNLTEDDVAAVVDSLRTEAEVVAGLYEVRRSTDPADDMFLACALEGRAEYVVSGDRHLLEIGFYHTVLVVTPRQFAAVLAAEKQGGRGAEEQRNRGHNRGSLPDGGGPFHLRDKVRRTSEQSAL